jgi:hypothetical protein
MSADRKGKTFETQRKGGSGVVGRDRVIARDLEIALIGKAGLSLMNADDADLNGEIEDFTADLHGSGRIGLLNRYGVPGSNMLSPS